MKILLLGEYSGLYRNLKSGLVALGHDVTVACEADGYKKIRGDIDLSSNLPRYLAAVSRRYKIVSAMRALQNYDVVQMVNPFIIPWRFLPGKERLIKRISDRNQKLFISAAGDDAYFWRYGKTRLRYGPFDDFLKYDLKSDKFYMQSQKAFDFNNYVISLSKGVIPIMYEYEESYRGHEKLLGTIPIPINTSKIAYYGCGKNKRIIIIHGLNRYGFKGTRHVEKAFEYLKSKYPNDLELIVHGKMPLVQYLSLMQRVDVVVDQMYSYSSGMNGIYALAMGKIVIGGCEPESMKSLGVTHSPIINVQPNAEDLILKIEDLLDNRSNLQAIGQEGRDFAENIHDHIKIAKRYIATWGNA